MKKKQLTTNMEVSGDLDKIILKCSFGGKALPEQGEETKKEQNVKQRQYKPPLFNFIVKDNRERNSSWRESSHQVCMVTRTNQYKGNMIQKRGDDSRKTVLHEREESRFNVRVKGLALAGPTCYTKRKGRVFEAGKCRMTELKNTKPHSA